MEVKLITDSACDLSIDYINKNDIDIASLMVNIDGKFIKDDLGQTLSHKEFYGLIRDGAMPSTTQVNASDFYEIFKKNIDKEILYIGISSALSGTINSANIARDMILEEYKDARIHIIDSLSVSSGEGLLVCKAVEMINSNKEVEEIIEYIESIKTKVIHAITVDDLNHLKRGGRISGTVAVVGGMLGIKPILKINEEGKVIPSDKIKGRKKALKYLVNQIGEKGENIDNQTIMVCEADCMDEAIEVQNMILKEYKVKDVIINSIGSVIGTHGGPGTLAVIFIGKER